MPQLLLAEKNFRTDILSFEKIRNDGDDRSIDVYDIITIYDNVNGSIDALIRSLHLVTKLHQAKTVIETIRRAWEKNFVCAP